MRLLRVSSSGGATFIEGISAQDLAADNSESFTTLAARPACWGARRDGTHSGGVRPGGRAGGGTLAAGKGMRCREAGSRCSTQPWLRGPSCECSLSCKLMHRQRQRKVSCACLGERPERGSSSSLDSRLARMRRNHHSASGWLRRWTPRRERTARTLSLRFSCLGFIGYPHVMNKYRIPSSNLTLFTIFFGILIPKVNNVSFVNMDIYAKVSPRRCGRIRGTTR